LVDIQPKGLFRDALDVEECDLHTKSLTPANTTYRVYYYAGGRPIAMREMPPNDNTGTLYYLHSDHLGSTSVTTCGSGSCGTAGTVVAQQWYYPFGSVRGSVGTLPTQRTFTGQYSHDASLGSLMHFNARYMSPLIGRFLSADSIVPEPGNPQAFNRFSYVINNPLRLVDPTGHTYLCDWICEIRLQVGMRPTPPRAPKKPNNPVDKLDSGLPIATGCAGLPCPGAGNGPNVSPVSPTLPNSGNTEVKPIISNPVGPSLAWDVASEAAPYVVAGLPDIRFGIAIEGKITRYTLRPSSLKIGNTSVSTIGGYVVGVGPNLIDNIGSGRSPGRVISDFLIDTTSVSAAVAVAASTGGWGGLITGTGAGTATEGVFNYVNARENVPIVFDMYFLYQGALAVNAMEHGVEWRYLVGRR
jgi:RHS repeat-associated protein